MINNKPVIKCQMLQDYTYTCFLELSNVQRQQVVWWGQSLRGRVGRELTMESQSASERFWRVLSLVNMLHTPKIITMLNFMFYVFH